MLAAAPALAQTAPETVRTQTNTEVDTVIVTGGRVRQLEQFTPTGSRLGLSAKDTPASLDLVDSETMSRLGYTTVEQAAVSLPGVIAGGSPGDASNYSMRGFTGAQITILHNGLYTGPSNMTGRPENTFNLESVEILKGPASVIYGQGAIGGVVNVTNKAPRFGAPAYQVQVSGGSFGTSSFGVAASGQLSDQVASRIDVSRTETDGFVDRTPSDAFNATASMLWRPSDKLHVQFTVDYAQDHPTTYFGTPLVPASFATQPLDVVSTRTGETIDKRTRFVNYNVGDAKIASHQIWPELYVEWSPADGVTVRNLAYYFNASRRWLNSEVYQFNATTRLIDRDRFFVFHEQDLSGDQASVTIDRPVFGIANKFVAGIDYSHLDFVRDRGFPDGDSVDPFNPQPGLFGPIVKRTSPTKWDSTAVFFEDLVSVTPQLKLIVGGRADNLNLDRKNYGPTGAFQPASSFSRTYHPVTWRVGAVYDVTENITPYFSYSTGQDPVGSSNLFLVNSGENFKMSSARQFEAGVKASLPDRRGALTFAIYDIERKNILTQVAVDTVSNVGSQKSRGVEVSADYQILPNWVVNANAAYTDAKYGQFVDPDFGISATGNRPANVPKWTGNLRTSVMNIVGLPLEAGGGVRYIDDRFGNTSNSLVLKSYALVDLYATYVLTPHASLTARVLNATDEEYAGWADVFYPSEVILGAPRSYELSLNVRF
jgi:iron complex outermembrane receptor protein